MATAEKKIVYHIDDIVRIIEPQVFVRVGYPLTKEQAIEAAVKEYNEQIYAFMAAISGAPEQFTVHEQDPTLYHDLVDALASYWIRQKGFGGKERKIYTETIEEIRNTGNWRVFSKRIVKTGTYNPGGMYGGGWATEPDYEPPYLANEKSHVLLSLIRECEGPFDVGAIDHVEIEATNVTFDERSDLPSAD